MLAGDCRQSSSSSEIATDRQAPQPELRYSCRLLFAQKKTRTLRARVFRDQRLLKQLQSGFRNRQKLVGRQPYLVVGLDKVVDDIAINIHDVNIGYGQRIVLAD